MDAWSVVGVVIIVAIAGWGVRLLKVRMEEQRYRQELADLEFEGSLLSDYGVAANNEDDMRFQQFTPVATQPDVPAAAVNVDNAMPVTPQTNSNNEPVAAEKAMPYVMQQLNQSGLLREIEGYVELHGNPKGAAIGRLRSGKRVLLVPNMESEGFLRRHSRRVDMVIMAGKDGKAVVITPLEELISQNILPGQ